MAVNPDPEFGDGAAVSHDLDKTIADPYLVLPEFEASKEITFGPRNIQSVPLSEINVMPQARKTFKRDALDSLKKSIRGRISLVPDDPEATIFLRDEDDGAQDGGYDLMQNVTINELTPAAFACYLEHVGKYWQIELDVASFVPNHRGNYYALIGGERRVRVISEIASEDGIALDKARIQSSIRFVTLFGAMELQIDENFHEGLPAHEEAAMIERYYTFGRQEGVIRDISDVVARLPYSETKIREALRFCQLPYTVRSYVEQGLLTYGASLELYPLLDYLREVRLYDQELLDEEMMTEAAYAMGRSVVQTAERISGRILDMRTVDYSELFDAEQLFDTAQMQERQSRINSLRRERIQKFRDLGTDSVRKLRELVKLERDAARLGHGHIVSDQRFAALLGDLANEAMEMAAIQGGDKLITAAEFKIRVEELTRVTLENGIGLVEELLPSHEANLRL